LNIIESTAPIPTKCCAVTKPPNTLRGWSKVKQAYDKSKMAYCRHLEKYLGHYLTDRREIWHCDAYLPCEPYQQLKFEFTKFKMADDRHFDNSCYNSATIRPVSTIFRMMMHVDPVNPIGR